MTPRQRLVLLTLICATLVLAVLLAACGTDRQVVVTGPPTTQPIVGLSADVSAVELSWTTSTTTTIGGRAPDEPAGLQNRAARVRVPAAPHIPGLLPAYVNGTGCDDACRAANRALGHHLTLEAGFGEQGFACIDNIVQHESRWDHLVWNSAGSSAYGIPQALPGSKMGPGWQHDPEVQIRWMLRYVVDRYGGPCEAWAFRRARGWY